MTAELAASLGMLVVSSVLVTAGTIAIRGEVHHRGGRGWRATLALLAETFTAPSGVVCPAERIEP